MSALGQHLCLCCRWQNMAISASIALSLNANIGFEVLPLRTSRVEIVRGKLFARKHFWVTAARRVSPQGPIQTLSWLVGSHRRTGQEGRGGAVAPLGFGKLVKFGQMEWEIRAFRGLNFENLYSPQMVELRNNNNNNNLKKLHEKSTSDNCNNSRSRF